MPKKQPHILLGMLVANGDCLMATVLAKQIKKDYPGCHLTWAISDKCRPMIEHNPDVDAIWEIPLRDKKAGENQAWYDFVKQAEERRTRGDFDELFFTQVYPSNVHRFDGTTRGTIYNAYPRPVTVDPRPVLRLTETEVQRVKTFAERNKLQVYRHVLLFECSSFSGQSFVTPEWAMEVSTGLVNRHDDLMVIISTHEELPSGHPRIITANELTLRENAELTHYCTLLAGCSSGITWIATTDRAKRLPMVQFLKRGIGFTFASVAYDHRYWKLDDSMIIESSRSETNHAVMLLNDVLLNGVESSKAKYHQALKPRFISLLKYSFMFFRRLQFARSVAIIRQFIRRNYSGRHN